MDTEPICTGAESGEFMFAPVLENVLEMSHTSGIFHASFELLLGKNIENSFNK